MRIRGLAAFAKDGRLLDHVLPCLEPSSEQAVELQQEQVQTLAVTQIED